MSVSPADISMILKGGIAKGIQNLELLLRPFQMTGVGNDAFEKAAYPLVCLNKKDSRSKFICAAVFLYVLITHGLHPAGHHTAEHAMFSDRINLPPSHLRAPLPSDALLAFNSDFPTLF